MNKPDRSHKVIVGVLNWGLGHATRCIPLIKSLEENGLRPILASDGEALALLRESFPHLGWEELPSYNIKYSKRLGALASVILRSPQIWIAARKENLLLKKLVEKHRPSGILSDNRLGFYHKDVPSVYISHQLKMMLPFARGFASSVHQYFIRKFNQCWVPDFSGSNSLSGEMTQNINTGLPTYFIGPLSRFQKPESKSTEVEYETCTVLSGPEPQRSVLERSIHNQLSQIPGKHLLIRGSKQIENELAKTESIKVIDFLSGESLAQAITRSALVISRSGYSSIMDYSVLGNRALLIPTPGQPEQEYLARYVLSSGWFFYVDQERLNLADDIPKAKQYDGVIDRGGTSEKVDYQNLLGLFKGK